MCSFGNGPTAYIIGVWRIPRKPRETTGDLDPIKTGSADKLRVHLDVVSMKDPDFHFCA